MKKLTDNQQKTIRCLHLHTTLLNLGYTAIGEALNDYCLPYFMKHETGKVICLDETGLSYRVMGKLETVNFE